jgi:hypothetical protein
MPERARRSITRTIAEVTTATAATLVLSTSLASAAEASTTPAGVTMAGYPEVRCAPGGGKTRIVQDYEDRHVVVKGVNSQNPKISKEIADVDFHQGNWLIPPKINWSGLTLSSISAAALFDSSKTIVNTVAPNGAEQNVTEITDRGYKQKTVIYDILVSEIPDASGNGNSGVFGVKCDTKQ